MIDHRESVMNVQNFAWLRKFGVIAFLLAFIGYQRAQDSTLIVYVPDGTHASLWPRESDYQAWVADPWTQSVDVRYGPSGHEVLHYVPRLPLASWNDSCISVDQHVIEGACPFITSMSLKISGDYDLPYVFGVMTRLHQLYGLEKTHVRVLPGGTVVVDIPQYEIVLGRRHMLERLLRAYYALERREWTGVSGRLDMRYPDGFAWQPK